MTVRELLEMMQEDIMVQLVPADEETLIFKIHNNQFTDPVDCFLSGNGIEIDNLIVTKIDVNVTFDCNTPRDIHYIPIIIIAVTEKGE